MINDDVIMKRECHKNTKAISAETETLSLFRTQNLLKKLIICHF